MSNTCRHCNRNFQIFPAELDFFSKISPEFNGKRFAIPPPTLCPDCRMQRRCIWRNEFSYYARKCDLCEKRIISVHSADKPYPVYCNQCWWSDAWDPYSYGKEIDFTKSFFEQFTELQKKMPKPSMANDNHIASENIEYCQGLAYSKNCYLVTTSWRLEDSLYCSNCGEAKDLLDCRFVGQGSELVYESASCVKVYSSSFLYGCDSCSDCHLGIDLRGCANCFCCIGLRQKEYCFFNQQCSKQEYQEKIAEYRNGSYQALEAAKKEFTKFAKLQPQKAVFQVNCENSSGNNLYFCKNFIGFNVIAGEDSRYYVIGTRPVHCQDILVGGEHSWCYEGVNPDHSYMSHFTVWCWSCKNTLYSDNCHSSNNIFGCIGLRHAEYSILNKKYSKEDYSILVTKLIEQMKTRSEWGEFFPFGVSQFSYNETIAQDYFPISENEANKLGANWQNTSSRPTGNINFKIPDQISEISDSIVSEILACEECKNGFKIMTLELKFYRKMNLPLPHNCPDCRRKNRFSRTGSFKLFPAKCYGCALDIEAAEPANKESKIFCNSCYEKILHL